MSYRFEGHETVPEAVKRIALEQSQKALEQLKSPRSRDDAIHDARVSFKKLRALLKLIRDGLGKGVYQQENIGYRDAGRRLASVRDSAALLESLDKLAERFDEQLAPDAFAGTRKSFKQAKKKRQTEKKKILSETAKLIQAAQQDIASWPIKDDDFLALRLGLQRVYKQGRTGMKLAYDEPDTRHFHEWRKRVKNLFYQLRILRPIWPDVIGELAGELKKLARYLSDDHDLALLHKRITEHVNDTVDVKEIEVLVSLINQRREELQMKARPLGERIYVEKPKAFVGRLEAYWEAWGCEAKPKK